MSSTSVNYRETPSLIKKLQLNGHLRGIAVLNNEIFIAFEGRSEIQIFNCDTMECERRISVQGTVLDIISYEYSLFVGILNNAITPYINNALYKTARNRKYKNKHPYGDESLACFHLGLKNAREQGNSIMRIDMPSMQTNDWSTDDATNQNEFAVQVGEAVMHSLSMTKKGNLLLCFSMENKLKEYTIEGVLVRTISVGPNPNPVLGVYEQYPNEYSASMFGIISQAFHLTCDQFVVLSEQSYVHIINNGGKLITKKTKQNQQPTTCASCIFVDRKDMILVANHQNDQLTLMNSSLDPVKVILPQLSSHSSQVSKIFVDQKDGKLYFNDIYTNVLTIMQF